MASRVKRTYNLSEGTVRRVRELADEHGVFRTQDSVIETAVERLYASVRAEAETARWEAAAGDSEFQEEMVALARVFEDRDTWPA